MISKAGLYALHGGVSVERVTVVATRIAFIDAIASATRMKARRLRRRLLAIANAEKTTAPKREEEVA